MITVSHVYKGIKGREVLRDISFVIHPGEIIGVIGVSGSGKSTLIKLVAGILEVDSGYLRVNYMDPMSFCHSFNNQIGIVCQNFYNISDDNMSIYENLRLIKKIYHISEKYYTDVMESVQELINVDVILNKIPSQLSQGERSKIELLFILLARPKIWLLNQPTLGMDYESRLKTYQLIRKFQEYEKMEKITVLLETNNLHEVEAICDRVFVLKDKCLIFKGSLEDLKSKYVSLGIVQFEIAFGEIMLVDIPFVSYEIEGCHVKLIYEKKHIDAVSILKYVQRNAKINRIMISDMDIETIVKNLV